MGGSGGDTSPEQALTAVDDDVRGDLLKLCVYYLSLRCEGSVISAPNSPLVDLTEIEELSPRHQHTQRPLIDDKYNEYSLQVGVPFGDVVAEKMAAMDKIAQLSEAFCRTYEPVSPPVQ